MFKRTFPILIGFLILLGAIVPQSFAQEIIISPVFMQLSELAETHTPKTAINYLPLMLDELMAQGMVVLNDPEVQAAASNAAAVLEQAEAPYDSFVTPDYNEVTDTMGREIQKALQGTQTAAETIATSEQLVKDIVSQRTG